MEKFFLIIQIIISFIILFFLFSEVCPPKQKYIKKILSILLLVLTCIHTAFSFAIQDVDYFCTFCFYAASIKFIVSSYKKRKEVKK